MTGWEQGILLAFTLFIGIICGLTALFMVTTRKALHRHLEEHQHPHSEDEDPLS